MTTGQRIKAARKKAGMTQSELSSKLNIPYQSISQWERDLRNPKRETLQSIADALCIPVRDLMDTSAYDEGFKDGSEAEEWQNHVIDKLRKRDGYSGSDIETQLIRAFARLNPSGQKEAVKRIEELAEMPKYTVCFESLTPDEKQLAETGQWGKLWELQFGSCDSAENSET